MWSSQTTPPPTPSCLRTSTDWVSRVAARIALIVPVQAMGPIYLKMSDPTSWSIHWPSRTTPPIDTFCHSLSKQDLLRPHTYHSPVRATRRAYLTSRGTARWSVGLSSRTIPTLWVGCPVYVCRIIYPRPCASHGPYLSHITITIRPMGIELGPPLTGQFANPPYPSRLCSHIVSPEGDTQTCHQPSYAFRGCRTACRIGAPARD